MRTTGAKELKFPSLGYSDSIDGAQRFAFLTPASVNALGRLAYNPHFNGGTRPGLGKVSTASFDDPSGIFAVPWRGEDGSLHETVVVVSEGKLKSIDGNDAEPLVGYAVDDGGNFIVDDGGRKLVFVPQPVAEIGSGTAIGCVAEGKLYFIAEDGVKSFEPRTGIVLDVSDETYDATAMAYWRGRLVLFGADNVIHFSATLDAADFDVGKHYEVGTNATDISLADAGKIGSRVTAFIPVSDSLAYAATEHSLWRIDGDAVGGKVSKVSEEVGVVSSGAFAKGDSGEVAFLSHDGIYFLRGDGALQPLAGALDQSGKIHRRVFALERPNVSTKKWLVGYDRTLRGWLVLAITTGSLADDSWFIDEDRSAWPIQFSAASKPLAVCRAEGGVVSAAYFICKDGYVRCFGRDNANDGLADIISAVTIGPILHSTDGTQDSVLAELLCETDGNFTTDGVNASVLVGRTCDEVIGKAQSFVAWVASGAVGTATGEFARFALAAGWNRVIRPRARGNAFAVVLWRTSGRWAYSSMTSVSRACGRIRY